MTTIEIDADTMKPVYGKHDFPEDSGHENGDYQNTCCLCEALFWGHKRRVVCKVCQTKAERDNVIYITEGELDEIQRRIRNKAIIWAAISAAAGFATWVIVGWLMS